MQSPELVGPRFGLIGFVLVRLDIAAFEEEDQRARYRSLLGAHGKDVQRHPLARLIERDRHCVRQGGLELRRVADLVDGHVGDVVEDFRQRARVLGREMHDHPVSKVEVAGQFAEQRLERLHPAGRGAYPANRRGLRACVFSRVFRRVLGRVRAGPVALLVGQRFFPWRKVLHGPPPPCPSQTLVLAFFEKRTRPSNQLRAPVSAIVDPLLTYRKRTRIRRKIGRMRCRHLQLCDARLDGWNGSGRSPRFATRAGV